MININNIEDIYPAIDELIKVLPHKNEQRLSDILKHRMYKVSWTSRSELFEELQNVLRGFLQEKTSGFDKVIVDQIKQVLLTIEKST
jgi:hypothetical protein